MKHYRLYLLIGLLALFPAGKIYAMEPVAENVLDVSNAWIRAVPPVVDISAAYMLLKNNGTEDLVIVEAASDVAEHVELHSMSMDNDRMTMRKVEQIRIPAGATKALEPSGWHIMLINLTRPLEAGDKVAITLTLADGSEQTVSAEVRRMDMMDEDAGHKGSSKGSHKGSDKGSHKGSHKGS
ncbi:MAG: copper chaperone PCu(A)C, partial [Candidatus Omnitrophica bacterium]|nr:copper chaperone PCu(A)C [Candidatus Omnitrophota bacterium]